MAVVLPQSCFGCLGKTMWYHNHACIDVVMLFLLVLLYLLDPFRFFSSPRLCFKVRPDIKRILSGY